MTCFRMTIAYDGTGYCGWQVQPNGVTVQEKIEKVLQTLTNEKVKVHGSGRTDQGVHAHGQVAHFHLENKMPKPLSYIKRAINGMLPPDIRLLSIARTNPAFHARRSAKEKEYRYFIWNGPVLPPDLRHFRTHVPRRLDAAKMSNAASHLVGSHQFAAFSSIPISDQESTRRTITRVSVKRKGPEIVVRVAGDGFLYKMVRSIVGFLIRVGLGDMPADEARAILNSGVRTARVPTAPARGLFLWKVKY